MSSINRTFLLTLLQLAFVWLAFLLSLNIFPFDLSHGWMVIHPCIYFSLYVAGLRRQQSKQGHPYFPLLGCILQGFPLFHSGTADCCLLIQNSHSCLLISWNFFFFFCGSWSFFHHPLMSQAANSFWGKKSSIFARNHIGG